MKDVQELLKTKFCCMENECGKEYTTKLNLKRHILTSHIKSKRFPCDICLKEFSSKQNLKEHLFLHSGEKPYKCSLCFIRFRHVSSLSLHLKHHKIGMVDRKIKEPQFFDEETQTPDNFN